MNDIEKLADRALLREAKMQVDTETSPWVMIIVGVLLLGVAAIGIIFLNPWILIIGAGVIPFGTLVYTTFVIDPKTKAAIKVRHNELRKQYGLPTDEE